MASGRSVTLLKHPDMSIYPGETHSDGWIVFTGLHREVDLKTNLFIAPFRGDAEIPEKWWVELTDGSSHDSMPRLSPDLCATAGPRGGFGRESTIWMTPKHGVKQGIREILSFAAQPQGGHPNGERQKRA